MNCEDKYDFSGFDEDIGVVLEPSPPTRSRSGGATTVSGYSRGKSSISRSRSGSRKTRGSEREGAGGGDNTSLSSKARSVRPMTSSSRAGYQSNTDGNRSLSSKHSNALESAQAQLLQHRSTCLEHRAKEMKKTVNILLDSSCHLREKEKLAKSLDKAKEAVREDKEFSKFCQSNEVPELHDICLSFAVLFNLAICFEQNEQYDQAMSTYKLMLKTQNSAPNARNMHVNIGNLYYRQEQYKAAIKEYRIALDQVPETQRKMGFLISSNIGKALLKLGQYREAIAIFETIMSSSPNNETGFNLLVCYFALGDKHNMKRSFCSLIGRTLRDSPNEALLDLAPKTEETGLHNDPLTQYEAQIQKKTEETLLTAARLIAPCLDESDWSLGYLWVNEQLRPKYDDVANQMEIELALSYIERHDCHTAIKILKSFERKESTKRTAAATNLSFLQFQEGKYDEASRYADIALVTNRYNSKALVNKGNCLFVSGDHEGASSLYREAISLQANCVEAIYNLGMISLDKGQLNEAREVFNKFNVLVPNDPCAMYNIADSLDESGDTAIAIEWYEMLGASVPNDSGILARLAELSTKENNEGQVIHYNTETLRRDPVHIESLNSLVNWLVKNEMFEKSILMFERLRLIQPKEGKWALMLAHCHRRLGNKSQALEVYKQIYHIDAGNVDCLPHLIDLCNELGLPSDEYE